MLPFPSNITAHPDATPRFTETQAEHVAIKNAMACQDGNVVRQQINKATLSHDALQALLAHAFLRNSSLAIKQALLGHPACDLPTRQTALELAVQHNDLPFARLSFAVQGNGERSESVNVCDRLPHRTEKHLPYRPRWPRNPQKRQTLLDESNALLPDDSGSSRPQSDPHRSLLRNQGAHQATDDEGAHFPCALENCMHGLMREGNRKAASTLLVCLKRPLASGHRGSYRAQV